MKLVETINHEWIPLNEIDSLSRTPGPFPIIYITTKNGNSYILYQCDTDIQCDNGIIKLSDFFLLSDIKYFHQSDIEYIILYHPNPF